MIKSYQKAFKLIPKDILILIFVFGFAYIGNAYSSFYSLFLQQYVKVNIIDIGYALSASGAGSIIGTKLTGKLLKLFQPTMVVIISFSSLSILNFGTIFLSNHTLIILCYFFFIGVFGAFYRPAFQYRLAKIEDELIRKNAYALYRVCISTGGTIGILIGGLMADISYLLMAIFFASISILVSIFLLIKRDYISNSQGADEKTSLAQEKHPLLNKSFLLILLKLAIFSFAFFQTVAFIPIYYVEYLGLSKSQFGLILASDFVFILGLEVYLVNALNNYPNHVSLILGVIVFSSGFLLLYSGLSHITFLWLAYGLICLGDILFWPILLSDVAKLSKPMQRQAEYMIWYQMTISAVLLCYASIGSWIIAISNIYTLWLVCSAAPLIIIPIIWIEQFISSVCKTKSEQAHT